ncbi:Myosin light chain 3, related, partial [Eimeria tenella]
FVFEQQQELLKKTTNEFKKVSDAFKENNKEAQQIKRLAHLVMEYLNNTEQRAKAPPPPEPSPVVEEPEDSIAEQPSEQAPSLLASEEVIRAEFEKAAGPSQTLDRDSAAVLARRLGASPTVSEVSALPERVDLNTFLGFCSSGEAGDSVEGLASVFSLWDPQQKGFISKTLLKHILIHFGETLTAAEADLALQQLAGPQEQVDYVQFCQKASGASQKAARQLSKLLLLRLLQLLLLQLLQQLLLQLLLLQSPRLQLLLLQLLLLQLVLQLLPLQLVLLLPLLLLHLLLLLQLPLVLLLLPQLLHLLLQLLLVAVLL